MEDGNNRAKFESNIPWNVVLPVGFFTASFQQLCANEKGPGTTVKEIPVAAYFDSELQQLYLTPLGPTTARGVALDLAGYICETFSYAKEPSTVSIRPQEGPPLFSLTNICDSNIN
jgi:hypothetical protein